MSALINKMSQTKLPNMPNTKKKKKIQKEKEPNNCSKLCTQFSVHQYFKTHLLQYSSMPLEIGIGSSKIDRREEKKKLPNNKENKTNQRDKKKEYQEK